MTVYSMVACTKHTEIHFLFSLHCFCKMFLQLVVLYEHNAKYHQRSLGIAKSKQFWKSF